MNFCRKKSLKINSPEKKTSNHQSSYIWRALTIKKQSTTKIVMTAACSSTHMASLLHNSHTRS
jgi:hypothetical protein